MNQSQLVKTKKEAPNTSEAELFLFSIPEITAKIVSFIPGLKFFYTPLHWVFNWSQVKTLSLVSKRFYSTIRSLYETEFLKQSNFDVQRIPLKEEGDNSTLQDKEEFTVTFPENDHSNATSVLITEKLNPFCGYFEIELDNWKYSHNWKYSQFDPKDIKIDFENTHFLGIYVVVKNKDRDLNIRVFYTQRKNIQWVILPEFYEDPCFNASYTEPNKKALNNIAQKYKEYLYTKYLENNGPLKTVVIMPLDYEDFMFFKKHCCDSGYKITTHEEMGLIVTVENGEEEAIKMTQLLNSNNLSFSEGSEGGERVFWKTILQFEQKKLYIVCLEGKEFCINEWSLVEKQCKKHFFDVSKLNLNLGKKMSIGETYRAWNFYILNSRHILVSCSQMLPPSKFTKGNRKIFIYDLIDQKLVFEHVFFL